MINHPLMMGVILWYSFRHMKDIIKGLVYIGLFAVPCLTLYVANSFFFPYITGKNFAFRIIVEAVLGLWLILCLYDTTYRPRFSWLLVSF